MFKIITIFILSMSIIGCMTPKEAAYIMNSFSDGYNKGRNYSNITPYTSSPPVPITFGIPHKKNNSYNDFYNNSNSSYKSSFGNQYQYDLSKLTDRNRYSTDMSAQTRDLTNPWKNLERGMGQYGGGRYRD
uniref:hypothetical protein n=1 Tax=Candidatus Thiodubiliella endoseptemdiera TaxID=2738886 RepID=UPI0034DEA275